MNVYFRLLLNQEIFFFFDNQIKKLLTVRKHQNFIECSINKKEKGTHVCILVDKSQQHNQAQERSNGRGERDRETER